MTCESALALAMVLQLSGEAASPLNLPQAAADPWEASPTEQAVDEIIDTVLERYDRLTIPVTIDGVGPFRFMIDTGAQATAITTYVRDRVALEPAGTAILIGMASRGEVELVDVDQLALGSRTINNLLAPVLDRRNVGADGIIGLDSLQGLRVLLDFSANSIAVADAKELGGNRGYEIVVRARRNNGQLLITDAEVDGVRTAVIIDTGAQMSMGNLALKRRLRSRLSGTILSTDVLGNEMEGDVGMVDVLEIKGMTLANVALSYADTPAFEALGLNEQPALALGMQHLRMFDRVAIDFDTRRVLFDLPRGAGRRPLGEIFRPPG